MSADVVAVIALLAALWVWSTWPFWKMAVRELRAVYDMSADAMSGLGEWITNELFGPDEDSISLYELRCERCDQLIGTNKQRILVEQNRLWWTCQHCHASNCREYAGRNGHE